MEQMQRGGRQIPNIDSLNSSAVIKAQLDGGSCWMGEWHQCGQDLAIKLHATWDRVNTACAAAREKKNPTQQTADKTTQTSQRQVANVHVCFLLHVVPYRQITSDRPMSLCA